MYNLWFAKSGPLDTARSPQSKVLIADRPELNATYTVDKEGLESVGIKGIVS
jgi:hypothetical protein